MIEGLNKLYQGDFNHMVQEPQSDDSVTIVLFKRGEDKIYRFRVKDLYGPNEEVLEHEFIEAKPPQYILDRMKESKEHEPKSDIGPEETQAAPVP